MEGVFRRMLKKWRIWLPLLAVSWFWSLAYIEHAKSIQYYRGWPSAKERFGCSTLYHNPQDRRPDVSDGPLSDCVNPFRLKALAAANIVPFLLAAPILDVGDHFHWDEVMVAFISLTSTLVLFWSAVGSLIDRMLVKRGRAGQAFTPAVKS